MAIRIKPKTFGPVFLTMAADGTIAYTTASDSTDAAALADASPAGLILYSVAACIAISLRLAAEQKGVTLAPFRVRARSHKAEDLPSRFGTFEVEVVQEFTDDDELAAELLLMAKARCTVSNTLNATTTARLVGADD